MTFRTHGGARAGAGRKPVLDARGRQRMSHIERPAIDKRHPQHITLRVSPDLGWLRKRDTHAAVRGAMRQVLGRAAKFRIVHYSLQNTHLHLLVEAEDKSALSRGMQAFMISAAKRINAAISRRRRYARRRRGVVFIDRYHAEDLGWVRQVRNAISYVLNNWRRHHVDADPTHRLCGGQLDPFASGLAFFGFRERLSSQRPPGYEPPPTSLPQSWHLRAGWKKVPLVSCYDVPGATR